MKLTFVYARPEIVVNIDFEGILLALCRKVNNDQVRRKSRDGKGENRMTKKIIKSVILALLVINLVFVALNLFADSAGGHWVSIEGTEGWDPIQHVKTCICPRQWYQSHDCNCVIFVPDPPPNND